MFSLKITAKDSPVFQNDFKFQNRSANTSGRKAYCGTEEEKKNNYKKWTLRSATMPLNRACTLLGPNFKRNFTWQKFLSCCLMWRLKLSNFHALGTQKKIFQKLLLNQPTTLLLRLIYYYVTANKRLI